MTKQATTTTPDPELSTPLGSEPATLGGENARGEVPGCPTGLADQLPVRQSESDTPAPTKQPDKRTASSD